ncbi:hypothetical protein [Yersinia ruckeri]|uniref:hypothetical protein n=1 Tax=Yersinia ruckeri TaxID=29486 RepID=UPI002237F99E|nr:hypothetical protein [Yersinia ruckeri]MCW6598864.1 hypothetical protein [Yersinia ruckeri]
MHVKKVANEIEAVVSSQQAKQQATDKPVMSIRAGFAKAKKDYARSFEILKDR